MIENFKSYMSELWIGGVTFLLGFLNKVGSNLPLIHEFLGTISMALGCVACVIVILVNYRQAKINKLILEEKERRHHG